MQRLPIIYITLLTIIGAADVGAEDSTAKDNTQIDETRADLNNLTSVDDDVRRKALLDLVNEIQHDRIPDTGRYATHGDALLPVLHRVILDLDDPHAKKAVEAIWWLGTIAQMFAEVTLLDGDETGKVEMGAAAEKVRHYPIPSDYAPLKNALINVLRNSKDNEARYMAALSLADGFEPVSEVEEILVSQLPLEEPNWRVQSAVLGSLSEIADRNTIQRRTELAIIDALASPNKETRKIALRVLTRHQYDGALEKLIESLASVTDAYEYTQKITSVPRFGPLDDAEIEKIQATLEQAVAGLEDGLVKEEFNGAVQSVIEILKYANIDKEHEFGLIQARTNEVGLTSVFLHTAHRGLIPGTSIAAIGSEIGFIVIKRSKIEQESCAQLHTGSHPVVTYEVGPVMNAVSLDPAEIDNRIAYFSIGTPASLSNTSCTSNEGIHHSVWSREGSERVRVWSAYQYLGYALEPSCSDDELAE